MIPIILDVEASGSGTDSYPIEVGLVLGDGTPHNFLIAPMRGWTSWDKDAEKNHGISQEVLDAHGRSADEVAWRLNALLEGKTLYTDEWSSGPSWLTKLFDATHRSQAFKIVAMDELLSEEQLGVWDQTKEEVAQELGLVRHRASGDAKIVQEAFKRVQLAAA